MDYIIKVFSLYFSKQLIIINYLSSNGYNHDPIIDELVNETNSFGNIAKMQIAPEQGHFIELIVKLLKAKNCLEIGRFTGLSTLCIAKGLPPDGKIVSIDNSNEFLKFFQNQKLLRLVNY